MVHQEVLTRLDQIIQMVDAFSPADLALSKLRSDLDAANAREEFEEEFQAWVDAFEAREACVWTEF